MNQTIRFEMRGGVKYENKLTSKCVGLKIEDGFAYDGSPNGDICENREAIFVLHRGTVCLLGAFQRL